MDDPFIKELHKAGLDDVRPAAESAKIRGYLSTGNLGLNWIISGKFNGGWPLGHVAEIYGDPSTGKSFLIARAVAIALQGEGKALLDDTEHAFNPVWSATGLGVDVSRLAHTSSHTVEEHNNVCMAFIKAMETLKITANSLLALDSLALLSTEHEVKAGFEKESMSRAKVFKKHFRLAAAALSGLPAPYLVTNHTIANIGNMYQDKTTPGGGGLKFQASVRLELRNPARLRDVDKRYVGVRVTAFVEKNRLAPPWRSIMMIIPFFEPISPVSGLIGLLQFLKVVEKTPGHRIAYQGQDTGIYLHAGDLWKQDGSALDLMSKYPDLISDLDQVDWNKQGVGVEMQAEDESEEVAE